MFPKPFKSYREKNNYEEQKTYSGYWSNIHDSGKEERTTGTILCSWICAISFDLSFDPSFNLEPGVNAIFDRVTGRNRINSSNRIIN